MDHAQDTWSALSARVEAFVEAWSNAHSEPSLAAFVPTGPPALRRLVLIELIKVDLEQRWLHSRGPKRIEDYLADFPELASQGAPCDLLYEEYHIRREAGESVQPQSYFDRFPKQANELQRLLGVRELAKSCSVSRNRRRASVQLGEQIDDFELLTLVGTGAFAQVFLARQRSMQRLVALKVSADDGDEPQTMAQLDHPHIVRVYDQRVIADRECRLLYMQYVAGGSLHDVLERARELAESERSGGMLLAVVDRTLDQRGESPPTASRLRERLAQLTWPEVVCWIGARLASALAYANRQGVLHRDVKPANVLLSPEGSPRLADFNTSFSSKVDGASPAAFFGGSLAYMSPEQLEAFNPAHSREPDDLDERSDLYSLGVLLWELLTGHRPFPPEVVAPEWSDTIAGMAADRRDGPDETVAPLPPNCPPGLKAALMRCLAAEPADRPRNGDEFARELDLCLYPQTSQLLYPDPGSRRDWIRRHATPIVLLAGLVPNLLAAAYNFGYNYVEIVERVEGTKLAFWITQSVVNGISFPFAIVHYFYLFRPVSRAMKSRETSDAELKRVRKRCLALGQYAMWMSLIGWSIAGVAFPVGIWTLAGHVPTSALLHFFLSLILCGLIAAAYPFFTVTFFVARVLYPALRPTADPQSQLALERLSRQTWLYLLLAASVPMLAMTVLVFVGVSQSPLLALLGLGGLAGFVLAFWMARSIQNDLAALQIATSPNIDALSK